jgi:hypothetical protein
LKKSELKNTIKVDINIENKIDFNLAQGQYQTIVHLIQQNFPEINHTVQEKFFAPTPKFVHLKVNSSFFVDVLFMLFVINNFCLFCVYLFFIHSFVYLFYYIFYYL